MKKLKTISIIMVTIMLFAINRIDGQVLPPNDSAYHLVWCDNFNVPQLDTDKWLKRYPWHQPSNYDTNFCNSSGWVVPMASIKAWKSFNNHNLPDTTNCKINNGTLKLTTRKENYWGEVWNWPSGSLVRDTLPFKYTTAMLFSKYEFRYGYYEIRFKLPALPSSPKTLKGHGGTFWLWSGSYNYWSEIDIFEINAANNYVYSHGNHYQKTATSTADTNVVVHNKAFTPNTWHTAALNWTSNSMQFYKDDTLIWTSYNHPDSISAMPIIINLGGNYTPVDNYCIPFDTTTADSTHFPYTMEIDYIKVWQLKKDCNTDITLTSFDPSTYSNQLHKSVTMGTNVSITNLSNQSFWGSDHITLNAGTSIDANSNVLFNVTDCNNIIFFKTQYHNNNSSVKI